MTHGATRLPQAWHPVPWNWMSTDRVTSDTGLQSKRFVNSQRDREQSGFRNSFSWNCGGAEEQAVYASSGSTRMSTEFNL